MHRRQHIVAGGVAQIVRRQIVAAQPGIVAHEEVMTRFADQIGMLSLAQIPQMMVRVDQGHRIGRTVPYTAYSCTGCESSYLYIRSIVHHAAAIRTNIEIDDELLEQALRLTGSKLSGQSSNKACAL